ncbi:hypothetical protein [Streptomyces cyaneofuscatus]|uniref:hypothetical protein n=1 Tax=Streptomyces cyaneofuscatus TaxID=66883 RepID=UPI002FF30D8E
MTPTRPSCPGQRNQAGAPPWLKQLRERRQSVRAADFTRARQFVDRSGIIPLIHHAQLRARKSNAGRNRTVTLRALFIGMTLDSWRNQGRVVLAEVADILAHQLTPAARTQLALPAWPDTIDGFESAYLAVRRAFHAAEAVMDPSPLPKRRLARADVKRLEQEADQQDLTARRQLLVEVTNRLVEASLAPARTVIEEFWDGSAAVDATPIRTFSRGVSAKDPKTATDPDAAWYVRDGDHRDPAADPQERSPHNGKKTRKAKRYLYGFEATLVVTARPPPPRSAAAPRQPATPAATFPRSFSPSPSTNPDTTPPATPSPH